MNIAKLQTEFAALQNDPSLYLETNLYGREKALDYIQFIGEILCMQHSDPGLAALHEQALTLQAHLSEINTRLFNRLRADIQAGQYTRPALREQFNQFTTYVQGAHGQAHI